jgi:hypothetical protein
MYGSKWIQLSEHRLAAGCWHGHLCVLLWIQKTRIIVQWHLRWYMHERVGLHSSSWIYPPPCPWSPFTSSTKLISWFWFILLLMIWDMFKYLCGSFVAWVIFSKESLKLARYLYMIYAIKQIFLTGMLLKFLIESVKYVRSKFYII